MEPLTAEGTGSGAIRVVPYNPDWPFLFARIKHELVCHLGGLLDSVHHVGSTSVPGLAAKPKIDVDAVIADTARLEEAVALMRLKSEWAFQGEPYGDGVWTFTSGHGSWGARLYLCAPGTATHEKRILFRDWLRTHCEDAAKYEALKRRLAAEADGDWNAYTGGKSSFVTAIVERARLEVQADRQREKIDG
ncbi:MAG: GrpB family protein [Mesorhizobium sp.]|nr:GrpB family protein [Mesorhizobium sp.]MBL8576570.1 GrpB family protein [Mesorhizobium sp.]